MFAVILTSAIIAFLVFALIHNKKDPKKVVGVYNLPGKWYTLKYYTFLSLLVLRRLKYYIYGKEHYHKKEKFDKLQPLSSHALAFDAVFFHAVSQEGIYFCSGTERRHEAKVNGLVYILVPEVGLLLSEKLPNTLLDADPGSLLSLKEYAAEGITFTPVEPMRHWKVGYKGKMRLHSDPNKLVNVELEAKWTSDLPWFLFEVDLPAKVLARAIAKQPWDKTLFKALEEAHQVHYEQMGFMEGNLKIDNKDYPLKLDSFRDHSFGFKRDWSLMHRYIFHMFYLSDQTKVSLGIVSQPSTSSHLEMGYIVHPDKTLEPIEECDLVLYQHGENGTPSDELTFTFSANGVTYEVKVKYEITVVHFVGNNCEAKMFERFLTCEVNGVKGRGISEWHYNNRTYSKK